MEKPDNKCVASEEKVSLREFIRANTNELGFVFGALTVFLGVSAIPIPLARVGLSFPVAYLGYQVVREVWDQFPPKAKAERRLLRFKYGLVSILAVGIYFTFLKQWDMAGGKEPQPLILSVMLAAPLWIFSYELFSEDRKERIRIWLTKKDKRPLRIGSIVACEVLSVAVVYSLVLWASPLISLVARWTRIH